MDSLHTIIEDNASGDPDRFHDTVNVSLGTPTSSYNPQSAADEDALVHHARRQGTEFYFAAGNDPNVMNAGATAAFDEYGRRIEGIHSVGALSEKGYEKDYNIPGSRITDWENGEAYVSQENGPSSGYRSSRGYEPVSRPVASPVRRSSHDYGASDYESRRSGGNYEPAYRPAARYDDDDRSEHHHHSSSSSGHHHSSGRSRGFLGMFAT